jgi:hypothetical protein
MLVLATVSLRVTASISSTPRYALVADLVLALAQLAHLLKNNDLIIKNRLCFAVCFLFYSRSIL